MEDTKQIGMITEQKCFLKCLELGYIVSRPLFDNSRYDFLLDIGNGLIYKIQIKTSRWKDETKESFTFNGYSQHSTGNGNKRMKYTNKDIDFFMTEKDNVFYLIPATEEGFVEKTLRLIPPKSGQRKGINFAKDFIFEEVIKNL